MAFGTISYRNSVDGQTQPLSLILPEAEVGTGPFPVLYLLHGMGHDHTSWMRMTRIEHYVRPLPLIVVMPTTLWKGMYVDSVHAIRAASGIAQGLVDFIDSRFNTRPERGCRALCGLSMGGYGAFHLALSFPDRFAAAVSHSGSLLFGHVNACELPHDEKEASTRALLGHTVGPSPKGGPADLFASAGSVPVDQRPALRLDCGREDPLIEHSRTFHRHLEQIGYDHEYEEHPGAHSWDYWDEHVRESIDFILRTLGWQTSGS